ncbi:hypothetical protein LOK49_LG05G00383 [Camellia lanceoleosa]|uniref:Uncharacterized protein n=1 Tax=Camellia lanceoleosa TaxID=1840588 RepID=A0ACC0HT32_9ERIC|nr:hypothetical protein LOK49_LG05G00383 [Camellia lanceoleosa]
MKPQAHHNILDQNTQDKPYIIEQTNQRTPGNPNKHDQKTPAEPQDLQAASSQIQPRTCKQQTKIFSQQHTCMAESVCCPPSVHQSKQQSRPSPD